VIQLKPAIERKLPGSGTDTRCLMTICLAAICNDLTAIVTASDHMLTVQADEALTFEADVMLKMGHLARGWQMMYSGDDISHLAPLMGRIRNGLQQARDDEPHGFRTVAHVCNSVFRDYWEQSINEQVFALYDTTKREFLADRSRYNAKERLFLFEKIASFEIPLCMLVYGFGRDWSHIMTINSPGVAAHHDSVGFWAIGGGPERQIRVLETLAREKPMVKDVPNAILDVCDAKFRVEGDGIGRLTTVTILRPDDEYFLDPVAIEELHLLWDATHKPLQGTDREWGRSIVKRAIESATSYNKQQEEWEKKRREAGLHRS
jgi:hypothetical protein